MRLAVSIVCFVMAPLMAQPVDGRGWLQKGIQAYKGYRYQEAVEAFQRAVDLNPNEVNTHLYLATALMVQYIPGAESSENVEFARRAESEFDLVLRLDPINQTALMSLASLSYQKALGIQDSEKKFRKLDESASWYEKALAVDPRNKEAYYSIGVIDWFKMYADVVKARARLSMRPEEPGPLKDPAVRRQLRTRYGALIEDGISKLQKALEIDAAYDDAMTYLSLMIRYRADLVDSREKYRQEIEVADQWLGKALETRRNKTGSPGISGGVLGYVVPAPPPPPPPPPPAQSAPSPAIIGGVVGDVPPAQEPPPPAGSSEVQRIRVGGNDQQFKLIHRVDPVYPPLAKQARIQGTVRFTGIIGRDGSVLNLQLISGHPLLVESARQAVMQWLYKPTLLNGQLMEVVTQIDVGFSLSEAVVQ
jgi:TonB family protein